MKDTERVLVPELGASLGNFGICEISSFESYVVSAENMQGPNDPTNWYKVAQYGADNSIWLVKVTSMFKTYD